MLRKSPSQETQEEQKASLALLPATLLGANIFPFLSLNFTDEIRNIVSVSRFFKSCLTSYKGFLSALRSNIDRQNQHIAALDKTYQLSIAFKEQENQKKLAKLKEEFNKQMALLEEQFSGEKKEIEDDHIKLRKAASQLDDETIENFKMVIQQNIELLEEFNRLLDSECEKLVWWSLRIKYINSNANWLYLLFAYSLVFFAIVSLTALLIVTLSLLILMLAVTYIPTLMVLAPFILTITVSSTGPFLPALIVAPVLFGVWFAVTQFDYNIRQTKQELFDQREFSTVTGDVTEKFQQIKSENEPDNFPMTEQELQDNPFSALGVTDSIGTIRAAINSRILLFKSKKLELDNKESKQEKLKTPEPAATSSLSLD